MTAAMGCLDLRTTTMAFSLSFKSYRTFMLAAAIGTAALAPNAASAFGFGGGHFGGGFGGGHFGGGHFGGGFGGFHGGFGHQMPNHFAGLHNPGFGHHPFPGHFPHPHPFPHFPHCHHFGCGPVYGGSPVYDRPIETASVGVVREQSGYYREKMVPAPAISNCNADNGTYVLIGFVDTATAADVAKFLQAYEVAITDGPNQDSNFIIKLSDRKMTDKEVQAEMAEMQAEKSVVRFVSLPDTSSARN
jgi:hypothetical protein